MNAFEIRSALTCAKQSCPCHSSRGTLCHCPAHRDSDPSLSIRDGQTAPLLKCQTGCSNENVITALKARNLWPVREASEAPRRQAEPVKVYRYVRDDGSLAVEKGRFERLQRETGEVKKYFNWRLPGKTEWGGLDGLEVSSLPLFNLPGLLRHSDAPVFFVEGEKAAEACIFRGLVAVALAGGASQREFGDSLTYLLGREVIIWPDFDVDGWALMGRLMFHLPHARPIRVEGVKGADAHDYFESGGSIEALGKALGIRIPTVARMTEVTGWKALYRGEVAL